MEIHSVLPEERARTEKGETLPWGYRYADSTKNPRQPEESGPFGRNRSIRYTSSRRASTRAGTTPSRTKENSAVNDFSRLFTKEQDARREAGNITEPTEAIPLEKIPTECLLYGYQSKQSEWKVISRVERIVAPSIICEDYDREDPNLYLNSGSPMGFNRSNIHVQRNLSKEATAKARVYRGGNHWIKVTFDSWEAAERACFYTPIEIDGYMVHCEMWGGKGPLTDAPIPKSADVGSLLSAQKKARTVGVANGKASAVAGFEQAMIGTLPRNHMMPDVQYTKPKDDLDMEINSSPTASSATATGTQLQPMAQSTTDLRSRSVPNLPSMKPVPPTSSQFMTRAPGIKRVIMRPASEALPPKQSRVEVVLRAIPYLNWLLGLTTPPKNEGVKEGEKVPVGLIGEGPVVKDDGTWDADANGWYWRLWYLIDRMSGSDFCGLKED